MGLDDFFDEIQDRSGQNMSHHNTGRQTFLKANINVSICAFI